MAYSEDHIVLAAEYALGTLDAGERIQVQTMMAVDSDFAAICEAWEFRLSVLNQMVGLVEPRPELWERIKAAITGSKPGEVAPVQPEVATAEIIAPEPQAPMPSEAAAEAAAMPEEADGPQHQSPPLAAEPVAEAVRPNPAATDQSNVIQLTSKVRQLRTVANVM